MTFYEFSVITNTGFPYYHLKLKERPSNTNLYLRFFDFSEDSERVKPPLDPTGLFELNAGLVSALYEFARNIDKKIEILEFTTKKRKKSSTEYKGDVLITTQTETYLFHKSVREKVKLIHKEIIAPKVPLCSAYEILPQDQEKIKEILLDQKARDRIKENQKALKRRASQFLNEYRNYGLKGICITSFDLSPIIIYGEKFTLDDIEIILRNIGVIPEIGFSEWISRQSFHYNKQIWTYILNSGIGPTIEKSLFEPFFYLLIGEPDSYFGEFPAKVISEFNEILKTND
jgi:hypothetical protein